MTFVSLPARLQREAARNLDVEVPEGEPGADYSISRQTVELPFGRAHMFDDKKKNVAIAKPGDRLRIFTRGVVRVRNRIVQIAAHPMLHNFGVPTYRHIYRHGDIIGSMTFECDEQLDLRKLPWLYEIYIHDLAIK
jgi:hypothetical protein